MIHPQYILGIFDSDLGKFQIKKYKNCYKFRILIYNSDIKVLYKIKDRFKIGKIKYLEGKKLFILIIDKQLNILIEFFEKNKLLTYQGIMFKKFAYLYKKLILKDSDISEKELRRIINKLHYFLDFS